MYKKGIIAFILTLGMQMQAQSLSFRTLDPSDGLSHGIVYSACQDRDGYIWFATNNGVNRYDGYEFKVYSNLSGGYSSVNDAVRQVYSDLDGYVWAVGETSISRYDPQDDNFENSLHFEDRILSVNELEHDRLLVFQKEGIRCMEPSSGRCIEGYVPEEIASKTIYVNSIYRNVLYFLAVGNKVGFWNLSSGRIVWLNKLPDNLAIRSMLATENSLWIGTEGNGLYEVANDGSVLRHFDRTSGLSSNSVRALRLDSSGRLWVGTFAGLNIISGSSISTYFHNAGDKSSISANSIKSILRDSRDGMWLTTDFGGVSYWHPGNPSFTKIDNLEIENDSRLIQKISADYDGTLWMGMTYSSVTNYDPSTGRYRTYNLPAISGKTPDIRCIYPDDAEGCVFLGTQYVGLVQIDRKTGRGVHFNCPGASTAIYSIIPTYDRTLLLCTSNGVFILDRNSGQITPVCQDGIKGSIYSSILISPGVRLFGGIEGLFLTDDEGSDSTILPMPENLGQIHDVAFIYKSSSGDVYICANNLYKYVPSENELYTIDTSYLPASRVTSIVEDSSGRLWLYMNTGLFRYNPENGSLRHFGKESGLFDTTMGSSCLCRTPDGTVYFGTRDDVFHFNPDLLTDDMYSPEPIVTEIAASGKLINGEVDVKYDNNTISFKFITLNYRSCGKDIFTYRLAGYEDCFHTCVGSNSVSYFNLPSGSYIFELKAANVDGTQSEGLTQIPVRIRPFWAKTIVARICFSLLVLFVIAGLYLILAHKRDKVHLKELYDLKFDFFVNTLNELKTHITLISSPLQEMLSRSDSRWMNGRLRYVAKNADRLSHIIDQLQMLRKAELGILPLKVRSLDVDGTVREICSCYERHAIGRGIDFCFTAGLEGNNVPADKRYLEIIVNNLLAIAFENTIEGSVEAATSSAGDIFTLSVSYTGHVVSKESDRPGLELSIIKTLTENHHGNFSVESSPEKGIAFKVILPTDISEYRSEETDSSDRQLSQTDLAEYFTDGADLSAPNPEDNRKFGSVLISVADLNLNKYLQKSLQNSFDVTCAVDVPSAMSTLIDSDYDAVIAEYSREFDIGIMLCSHIKREPSTSSVPVIILSTRDKSSDIIEAYQAGADSYITIPFSVNELLIKLRNICSTHRCCVEKAVSSVQDKVTFKMGDNIFLEKATAFVMENLSNTDFSSRDFIKELGMSRTSLYTKFKNLTGESPIDFINSIRFKEAARLLEEGDKTIAEISRIVGFKTPSYFTRAFRKNFGLLPSQYIEKQRTK